MTLFPRSFLETTARATGAIRRQRVVRAVTMFWILVLGMNTHTLAGLHRAYQKASRRDLSRAAFYKRFTPGLVRFLRACVEHGIQEALHAAPRGLQERLRRFRDVLIQDSTIVRLHVALAKKWPATRSRKIAASIKVSLVVSVVAASVKSVNLFGERTSEARTMRLGNWIEASVLLFDLGFFSYGAFDRITRNKGFFVTRLKNNADPRITRLLRVVGGASVPVEGERFRDVLPRLKRDVLDAEVEVEFRRRTYAGKRRGASATYRLVCVRDNDTGEYHAYITNIPPDVLSAENVAALYSCRWEVELAFKEMKTHYALDEIRTRNPRIVEALVWACVVTMLVSRSLYRSLGALYAKDGLTRARFTPLRWAAVFAEDAADWLNAVLGLGLAERDVLRRCRRRAIDPNVRRERLADRLLA